MGVPVRFHLEPMDENDPAAGYRPVVDYRVLVDRNQLAEALIEEGLSTDVETILALFEAKQAAVASLLYEGLDVRVWGGTLETPWPDLEEFTLRGGTTSGRPTAGQDQLIKRMRDHGTPHTRSQIEAFLIALDQVARRLLFDGYEIELPTLMMRTGISGHFSRRDEEFDPARHRITIESETAAEVVDWLEGYRELERRGLDGPPRPILDSYDDLNTGESDGQLSPDHAVRLNGYWLRFWRPDSRQGIFFIAEDGTTTRQEVASVTGLNDVVFVVPHHLPPGAYWLEVRTVVLPRDGLQRSTLPHSIRIVAEEDAQEEKE